MIKIRIGAPKQTITKVFSWFCFLVVLFVLKKLQFAEVRVNMFQNFSRCYYLHGHEAQRARKGQKKDQRGEGQTLQVVDEFKYLGVMFTSNGRMTKAAERMQLPFL